MIWSPVGHRLLYSESADGLCLLDLDTGEKVFQSSGSILFLADQGGNYRYVSTDGGSVLCLSKNNAYFGESLLVSPDGRYSASSAQAARSRMVTADASFPLNEAGIGGREVSAELVATLARASPY